MSSSPVVVVTGANGLVGAAVCAALIERGATVRAVVRRDGAATVDGVEEHVGAFGDPSFAADVVAGADAVVTTVHPMGSDRATQHQVGVVDTSTLARAAAGAGVERFVHVSTAAVYDRSAGVGDVHEASALVGDDAGDYPVTKRDTDAALAEIDEITRVLLRPPAILGPGESSTWNTLRPAAIREGGGDTHAAPDQTFAWVHVDDLAVIAADLATGALAGPEPGTCTPVNVAAGPATQRDYYETVCAALGLEPTWASYEPWTGQIRADRARAWGWRPRIDKDAALAELADGLRG